jgi:hypothetical protein
VAFIIWHGIYGEGNRMISMQRGRALLAAARRSETFICGKAANADDPPHLHHIRPIILIREVSEWSVLFLNIEFSPNYVIIS